jgi:hypothetical protein
MLRSLGSGRLRLRFAAIELADGVGANRPRRDLHRFVFLTLAVRRQVDGADERAFNKYMSAFLDVVENGLSQPRAKYRDAMPLDFRDPFVFCVFPGALRGDGKNGKF